MLKNATFDLQGHRGARGLKPENTLPSFEAALDAAVTTIETDIHLSRDGVPILIHDAVLNDRVYRPTGGSAVPAPVLRPRVRDLTLQELRGYRADGNPDPHRFPEQDPGVTPVARLFAQRQGIDPYTIPTLDDFLSFTVAYAGELGAGMGKSALQRERAARVRFDLELKRIPFHPENLGDDFTGHEAGLLEKQVTNVVRRGGLLPRTLIRSFDHRSVAVVGTLEPGMTTVMLVADTAPLYPGKLAREAGTQVYAPDFRFVDPLAIRRAHDEGVRVIPWTVNDPEHWQRLLDWGVDGITTDYPDRLARFLIERGIAF